MALDIYLKIPGDPYYDPSELEVNDDLFNFVQAIEMILTTTKGDVFGEPELGANLEAYLWNPNISPAVIKTEINTQIFKYCPQYCRSISYDIDINFMSGDVVDYMVVDIIIDGQRVLGIVSTPTSDANVKVNK